MSGFRLLAPLEVINCPSPPGQFKDLPRSYPTVTYPELDNMAIKMRSSAGDFLKENRNAFDWTKNQQVYEKTLRDIKTNHACGNDHTYSASPL